MEKIKKNRRQRLALPDGGHYDLNFLMIYLLDKKGHDKANGNTTKKLHKREDKNNKNKGRTSIEGS